MGMEDTIVVTSLQIKWAPKRARKSLGTRREAGTVSLQTSKATGAADAEVLAIVLQNGDINFWKAHGLWSFFTAAKQTFTSS